MKNKIIKIFLAVIVALPAFTPVFAANTDVLAKLDVIAADIVTMKQEYNELLEEYAAVVDSLSDESRVVATTIADNLLADNAEELLKGLKDELRASTVADADKLLAGIENLENDAHDLVEENKNVVEELKAEASNMTVDEIKQAADKVKNIVESLGATVDTSATYAKVMSVLDDAHVMALEINEKVEDIIAGNLSTFKSALTKELIEELFDEVKNKDKEAVIDTLIEALDNVQGGAALKAELKAVKVMVQDLKDKLMELDLLDEQDLLMFTDAQKKNVSDKIKLVEKDYVDFAKVILDTYAEDYMEVVINLAYDETVDQMIEYGNKALDYYAEYKDTLDSLSVSMFVSKLPADMKELADKAGLMVALGFVDTSAYNKQYIKDNFGTQIDNMAEYLAQEIVDYIDHIDSTVNDEVMHTYLSGKAAPTVQDELRTITAARFNTLTNLKKLKTRVDTEVLANHEDLKADVSKLADYVYDIYNENILTSMTATIMKENDQENKEYVADGEKSCIITNKFMTTSYFTTELGVPTAHSKVVEYTGLANGKVKTGTEFMVTVSDTAVMRGIFAVLGDTFADGIVDARDYMVIKNYIMDGATVSNISLVAADTFRDEVVDARDYMAIKNYIMEGTKFSL